MAGNGYDQFFKQAQKATGVLKGTKATSSSQPKFKIQETKQPAKKARPQGKNLSPEERLRMELAQRIKQRREVAIKKRSRLPVYPIACTIAALLSCGVGYYFYDDIDSGLNSVLAKVEIGFLDSATAAESGKAAQAGSAKSEGKDTEKKSDPGQPDEEKTAAADGATKEPALPNVKQWTQEEISFFSKLSDRKKELDLREAELTKLEEELQKRKAELDERLKQLEGMREQIAQTLKARVATDQEKVAKLVEFYSNMKPQQAATVIETLNEDLAVEVLDKMKKKNAAEVLNMMDAKKARRLSELLTGYQRTPASAGQTQEAGSGPESEASKQ